MDLRFDLRRATGYRSSSQIARRLTEAWIVREAYCLNCGRGPLTQTSGNTRALDFRCSDCREPYELKSSRRPFGRRVLDGEYSTLVRALSSYDNPNLFLLNYDLAQMSVRDLRAIPRTVLSRLNVIPRRPLGPLARRAGWRGCSIDLEGLPPSAVIPIVTAMIPREMRVVLRDWRQFDYLSRSRASDRSWLPDILACVNRTQASDFALDEIYRFATELRVLHPQNKHIEPKIRQQLQILVAQGLLIRTSRGRYRKSGFFWAR